MELMTVIGILAIVSAIAIPNIIGWMPKHRLSNGARSLLSAFELARLTAVKQPTATVDINFDYNNDSYSIEVDDQPVRSGAMPAGVDLQAHGDEPVPSSIVFNSQGLPVNGSGTPVKGFIVVASGSLSPKNIKLSAAGNVNIESGG